MNGEYRPNIVTNEPLGAGNSEVWTVVAFFEVNPAIIEFEDQLCDPDDPVINTGFYNAVSGVDQETDLSDNDTCTDLEDLFFEGIPTLSRHGLAILALLMLGVGMVGFRRFA